MIEFISGSIFDAKEQFICHQTNCLTKKAAHLSYDMFQKFPYADIYTNRTDPDKPGNIIIKGNGQDQRLIVNILGQYYPGKPKYPDSTLDGFKARQKYFHQALVKISKISDLQSIAFPDHIACGAAGGNWEYYLGELTNFEKYVNSSFGTKVVIYKLESAI